MKHLAKKLLSLALIPTLVLGFTGCGNKNKDEDSLLNQVSKGSKDYVFALETLNVSDNPDDINRLAYVGDKVYASTYGNGEAVIIYSFNSDGTDVNTVKIPMTEDENFSYLSYDNEGNIYGVKYIYHWNFGDDDEMHTYDESDSEDGEESEETEETEETTNEDKDSDSEENIELSVEDVTENDDEVDTDSEEPESFSDMTLGEEETYYVKYDKDGNLLDKVDLVKEIGSDGYVSLNGFTVTEDGIALLSVDGNILSYTKDNGFKTLVDNSKSGSYNYYQFYRGFNNKIFVTYYGDNGLCLCSFDVSNGQLGEPASVLNSNMEYSFFGGSGYDLYISDSTAIYGYDLASDTATKILDYTDSDLELTSSISSCVGVSDVEFVACLPDAEYNYYLARLTKVPPEEVKDKQIITLGGYYIDYDIRRLAFAFNKKSNEYKIKFVDYSTYDGDDTYGAGSEKLNMDIVSGNTPDIILLDDDMPVDSYINKGLFCDLSTYLNNDPDISESDLLTNIVDAFKTGDKLYQIVPSFFITTMMVKSKYTGGKDVLTFKDCEDLMNKMGKDKSSAFGIMTRDEFLEDGIRASGNMYIDWQNKSCNFNSDSFIEFLKFSKGMTVEYPDNVWEDYKDTLYLTDDALFYISSVSTFDDFKYYKRGLFQTDISFVGYPNDMGVNNTIIYPGKRITISAQSRYKDACWDFIKTFLSEEYQDEVYNFPIRKSSFEKKADETTHRPYYMDEGKKVEYDETYYIGGQDIKVEPFSKEEILEYTNFIKSLKLVNNYNANVNNIIYEEASAFFSGQKTAEEVADIIQSRLSIYVNENS